VTLQLKVTEISWERVQLTFQLVFEGLQDVAAGDPDTEAVLDGRAEFRLKDGKRLLQAPATHLGGARYQLRINITQFGGRRQLPDGTWRVVGVINDEQLPGATYPIERAPELDDRSRVFMYDKNRTGYVVSFGYTEADDPPVMLMRAYQLFKKGSGKKRRGPIKKAKGIPKKLTSRASKTKLLNKFYRTVQRMHPHEGNRILFASEQRTELGGNLLRIRDRMVERGLDKDYQFDYSFRVPKNSNKESTLRAVYLLARADYVFIDDFFAMLDSLKLSKDTEVVQVWHAGSGFKSVGFSRFGKYGSPKLQNPHRKYTYAITGSKHLIPVYAEVFGIEESAVVPTGLPRIDTFIDPDRTLEATEQIYREHPDLKGKRIIMFAPTFRGRGIRDGFYPFDKIDFDALYEYCDEDTVVLFRMHHFVQEPVPIPPEYSDKFKDFSKFKNGNDLLHIVDLLITDYSSIIYEYSLLQRPMLFFAYDRDVYSATRGFHRDYGETAPGKVCLTFDDLMQALRDEDYEEWRRDAFLRENFDHVDSHSADRVIDWLILGKPIGSPVEGQDEIEGEATPDTIEGKTGSPEHAQTEEESA
jgi:CDP-ribitol ribitolphosphotransferase